MHAVTGLPTDLLAAIAANGGGKVALIVGAGCSVEAPTGIPAGRRASMECHESLLADGTLQAGDCARPEDLTCLADAVVSRTGNQDALVQALASRYCYRTATPNEGHLLAAAMLGEGAITFVLTLNFDLALSTAIAQLGLGNTVGIVDGPCALGQQKGANLYYLHGNVDSEPAAWILRSEDIKTGWARTWQPIVVTKVLATPVVVFAGLGSPADVLVTTVGLIRDAIGDTTKTYLVEPGDFKASEFYKALALDEAGVVATGWCDFMVALSQRIVREQTNLLRQEAATLIARERLDDEDISALVGRLAEMGLRGLGQVRSHWTLHDKPYCVDSRYVREWAADLLLATALIERVTGATAVLCADGVVEFRRGDRVVSTYLLVSGRGTHGVATLEATLPALQRKLWGRPNPPMGAIAANVGDYAPGLVPPRDVVRGDEDGSILTGVSATSLYLVGALRRDLSAVARLAP
jgi:hypothetical protein